MGILFFLVVHITDTFFVVFAPDWYDHTVALYGGVWFDGQYYWPLRWAFRVAELGLIASVVFHAVNGVGVILYDFWPRGSLYRKPILMGGPGVFWGIMLVTTPIVLYPLRKAPDRMAPGASRPTGRCRSVPLTRSSDIEFIEQDSTRMAARSMGRRHQAGRWL